MKVPALFHLLLLTFLLSSCVQSHPKKFAKVIHTRDELYDYLHGTVNSWPEKNHYLGTTKDGFHIVRTSYPPWWMFLEPRTAAIRQEVLPQWHLRPYPLALTRRLPVPWLIFCPSYPVPERVQRQWDERRREFQRQEQAVLRGLPTHPFNPHLPKLRSGTYALNNLSIDHLLLTTNQTPRKNDALSQLRQPDAEDLRQRDALMRAE